MLGGSTNGARAMAGVLAVVVGGGSSIGCFSPVDLPPPASPSREVPYQAAGLGPAPAGRQWVIIETPGHNAQVSSVIGNVTGTTPGGHEVTGEAKRDLCVTPCVTDMRQGSHTVVLASQTDPTANDRLDFTVPNEPLVVREILPQGGRTGLGSAGGLLAGLGATSAFTGVILLPIGVGLSKGMATASTGSVLEKAGIGTLAAGGGALLLGILLAYAGRGARTQGATTIFTLPSAGKTSSASSPGGPPALLRF